MSLEADVSSHYVLGALEQAISNAVRSSGKDADKLRPDDLAGADEFLLGNIMATLATGAIAPVQILARA